MRNMLRRRTRSLVAAMAIVMLVLPGIFAGGVTAETGVTADEEAPRALQQTGYAADYVCISNYTRAIRLVFNTTSCTFGETLVQISQSLPFDYCYSLYTGVISDDLRGDQCSFGHRYVVVDGSTSFFVCANIYNGVLYQIADPEDCTSGILVFFIDLRGDLTKYVCVEENLNATQCDVFPAGPQNEIRQIGPMPNTSGGFFDIQWRWVFDGNNSPTQKCSANNDCDNVAIEAALEALPGINDVTVTGGPIAGTINAPIRIEFVGVDAQTDIIPQIQIQNVANTVNQSDTTVLNGDPSGPLVSYVMPGGTVQIFVAGAATDPNDPTTYGAEVTGGPQPVDANGRFISTDLLEGDYVVCATGTSAVAPSCEIITVNANTQTIVNNVDMFGMVTAAITDTVGGNEIRSYDDFPFGGGAVTGGQYSITVGPDTTAMLNHDANAATIEAALEGLGSVGAGNVSVTGGPPPVFGPPIVIEFIGALAGTDVPNIVLNTGGLTGGIYIQDPNLTDRDGFGTVQTLTADARVSGGTFTLTYDNGTISDTTGPLDFDATVNEIEAALNGLASITDGGGSVNAFSTDPGVIPGNEPITKAPVEIQFVNVTNSDTNVLVVDNTNLE